MAINSLYKGLAGDVFSYGLLDSLTRLISFLLLPILTRVFSVAEYGIIDLIAAFSSFFVSFSTLGLPGALARYYRSDEEKGEQNRTLFTSLLMFNSIFSVLLLILVIVFSRDISTWVADDGKYSFFIRLGAFGGLFQSLGNIPQMLLRRRRKLKIFGAVKISTSLLYVGLTVLLVLVYDFGLQGVFMAHALAFFAGFLISLGVTHKYLIKALSIVDLKKSLRYSLPMFPSIFVTWANEQFNRFIIINMLNASVLGLFGAAFRVSGIIRILTQVFRKAWVPFSMQIIEEKSRGELINGLMRYYLTYFLLLSLLFSMVAPEIIGLLLPDEYFEAYLIIPWLTGAFVVHNSGSILNMGSVIKERTLVNSIAAWSGFVVNVTLCLILIKPYGVVGAAIGLFVASLVANTILLRKTERITEIRFSKPYLVLLVLIYILGSIGLLEVVRSTDNIYISLLLRAIMFFGIIVLIDRVMWKNVISLLLWKIYRKAKPVFLRR